MFSAKTFNAAHTVFYAVRRNGNNLSHLMRFALRILLFAYVGGTELCSRLWLYRMPKLSNSHLLKRLRTMLLPSTLFCSLALGFFALLCAKLGNAYILSGFLAAFFASVGITDFASGFVAYLPAHSRSTLFCPGFGRGFYSQARSSKRGDVESPRAKGIKLTKPILFAGGQGQRQQNQFENLKDEELFSILIPCCLQFRISMGSMPEVMEMLALAHSQIYGASNVNSFRRCATNAINARRIRNGVAFWSTMRLHLHNLLHRLVGVWLGLASTIPTPPHYTPSTPSLSNFVEVGYGC